MWRGQKSLNGFKFGILIGRFPSDGGASMAVKGLMLSFAAWSAEPIVIKLGVKIHLDVRFLTIQCV